MRSLNSLDIGVYGARGIPSTYSGFETFLTALLPALAERGHQVTMYCRPQEVTGDGDYRGVQRVILPCLNTKQLGTLSHGLFAGIRARVAHHDVVFGVNVANAPFCLMARMTGQRTVLNTDGQEWLRGKWGPAAKAFFRGSARLSRLATSALVADCNGMREIYLNQFKADSTVIPYCWTDIEPVGTQALATLGLADKEYFLVAGRFVPENNIERVAQAYIDSGSELPLVVLGAANYDSPVTRTISRLATQNQHLRQLGHVDNRITFASLLRHARAYVHGHSVGGINPSLIEAMGCGSRIIALDTPFNREALGDAGSYFDDFHKSLPPLFASLSEESSGEKDGILRTLASSRVKGRFTLDSVADAYEGLFREVANHRPWKRITMETRWQIERPASHAEPDLLLQPLDESS